MSAVRILRGSSQVEELRQGRRGKINKERNAIMYIARQEFGFSLSEIGSEFGGVKYTAVSENIKKAKGELKKNNLLMKAANEIISEVKSN